MVAIIFNKHAWTTSRKTKNISSNLKYESNWYDTDDDTSTEAVEERAERAEERLRKSRREISHGTRKMD